MRIPGAKSLRMAGHWLRSRLSGGALILGYHRVADVEIDPHAMCVSPRHFEEQLAVLQRAARPMSLPALARALHEGNVPARAVAITFDDGYLDNLHIARPLLAAYELPATVFAVTGALGQEFWWDRLVRIVLSPAVLPPSLSLPIGGEEFSWTAPDTTGPRRRLLAALYSRLWALRAEERRSLLQQLEEWAGSERPLSPPGERAMTGAELREWSGDGLMTVGSHTVSHQPLTTLSPAERQAELCKSRQALTEILGHAPLSFSYPHGDNDAETRRLVQEAGFELACASRPGMVHGRQEPMALPRFWPPDWNGEQFGRWLNRWLGS